MLRQFAKQCEEFNLGLTPNLKPDMHTPSVIPKRNLFLAKGAQSMWRRGVAGRTTLTARASHTIKARGTLRFCSYLFNFLRRLPTRQDALRLMPEMKCRCVAAFEPGQRRPRRFDLKITQLGDTVRLKTQLFNAHTSRTALNPRSEAGGFAGGDAGFVPAERLVHQMILQCVHPVLQKKSLLGFRSASQFKLAVKKSGFNGIVQRVGEAELGLPSLMMSGFITSKFRAFCTKAVSAYSAD